MSSSNTFSTLPTDKQIQLAKRMLSLHEWSPHAYGHYWKTTQEQHGECTKNDISKSCKVVREPITVELLLRHLRGEYPLGGFPLWDDSTCRHSALDVDNYALDYGDMGRRIKQSKLPLIFVTTKSAGGRLILPCKQREPAAFVRKVMAKCRLLLGLNDGSADEIFPKQDEWNTKIKDFCGNWYALPYLGEEWCPGTVALQVARNEMGNAMLLEEYLNLYERLQVSHEDMEAILARNTRKAGVGGGEVWNDNLTDEEFLAGAPPCIHNMRSCKVNEGERNICITHCAAFGRKKYPDNIQGTLDKLNAMVMAAPLPEEEVSKLAQRTRDKEIGNGYMCEQVTGYCDKQICKKVKYGPFSRGNGGDASEPFTISIDEIIGQQRLAVITLNGQTFTLPATDMNKWVKFGDAAMEQLGLNVHKFGKKELIRAVYEAWEQRGQIPPATDFEPNATLRDYVTEFVQWWASLNYSNIGDDGVSRNQPLGKDTVGEVWYDNRVDPPLLMFKMAKLEKFLWDRHGYKHDRFLLGRYLASIGGTNFSPNYMKGLERRQRFTWGLPVPPEVVENAEEHAETSRFYRSNAQQQGHFH